MRFWFLPDPEDEPFRFDTRDPVDEAFEDYQQSIAEILDADPVRRDEVIRDLEAATAAWERASFDLIVSRLRRDLAFRLAIRRAFKTRPTT